MNWYFAEISEYTSLLDKNGFEVNYTRFYDESTALFDDENRNKD